MFQQTDLAPVAGEKAQGTLKGNLFLIRDAHPNIVQATDERLARLFVNEGSLGYTWTVDIISIMGGLGTLISDEGKVAIKKQLDVVIPAHDIRHLTLVWPWYEKRKSISKEGAWLSHRECMGLLPSIKEAISQIGPGIYIDAMDLGNHLPQPPPRTRTLCWTCIDPRFTEHHQKVRPDDSYHLGIAGGSYALQHGHTARYTRRQLRAATEQGIDQALIVDHQDCLVCKEPRQSLGHAASRLINEFNFKKVLTFITMLNGQLVPIGEYG